MSVAGRKTIELFYDVVSPYSWIGFEVMCRYRAKWNIDLQFKPVFLGGIMQGAGNKPPGLVPNKFMYMGKDLHRLRQFYQIPINIPSNPEGVIFGKASLVPMRFLTAIDMMCPEFTEALSRELWLRIFGRDPAHVMFEKGSLTAMRFVTAVNQAQSQKTEDVSRELWRRIWGSDQDITTPESLMQAGLKAGLSEAVVKDALSKLKDQDVKDRLKKNTDQALEYGAFGAPTMIIHMPDGKTHMFFGSDRFELMAHVIGEKYEGPLTSLAQAKL